MSAKLKPRKPTAKPLPRGRHGLPAHEVKSSQRSRLTRAMLERVAAGGYAATSVPAVVAQARVSRNAFYEFFADKEACFLAACEDEAQHLARDMLAASGDGPWTGRLLRGLEFYLQWWSARPEMARAYFAEMPAAGERAVQQRDRAYRPFIQIFEQLGVLARRQQPKLAALPAFLPRMMVISMTEFVAAEVRAGRTAQLPRRRNELGFYLVKLLADDSAARELAA